MSEPPVVAGGSTLFFVRSASQMVFFNRPLPQTVLTGQAEVAKLADALDLGSSVERRASSSLALGTKLKGRSLTVREGFSIWPDISPP